MPRGKTFDAECRRLAALIRRNADRCETATGPRCKCHCGGAQHGKPHSARWVANTARAMTRAQYEGAQAELELEQ
jgi:hypothetical protein